MLAQRCLRYTLAPAGLLFLVILVVGPFSMLYVPSQILVAGDASATAENVRNSAGLLRLGMLGDTIIFLTEVAMAAVLYALFRQVNRALALTMGLARLSEAVMQSFAPRCMCPRTSSHVILCTTYEVEVALGALSPLSPK
jgi:Domain of unknown function (DUF4386)